MDSFELGLKTRREVLGDAYVDSAVKTDDAFSLPFQKLVTAYCWGDIWNGPALSRRDRSLMNVAMLSALNRPAELRTHIRAALGNGLSQEEIADALLQVTVYCGVPCGVEAMRAAKEVLSAIDAAEGKKND